MKTMCWFRLLIYWYQVGCLCYSAKGIQCHKKSVIEKYLCYHWRIGNFCDWYFNSIHYFIKVVNMVLKESVLCCFFPPSTKKIYTMSNTFEHCTQIRWNWQNSFYHKKLPFSSLEFNRGMGLHYWGQVIINLIVLVLLA